MIGNVLEEKKKKNIVKIGGKRIPRGTRDELS